MADLQPVVVIPAFKPGESLLQLVDELARAGMRSVVVVDDGSGPAFNAIFQCLKEMPGVKVLEHAVNLGKGQALKTGFNFALLFRADSIGVVTADADGQHRPHDIKAVAERLIAEPQAMILGARRFKGEIPLRSRFGNALTKRIFRFLVGPGVTDTQTGLRGLPMEFLKPLLGLKSTGYEFELDMLILASTGQRRRIIEVPIATIYESGNPTSHFCPLKDSARVYFVFLRFILSSLLTFLIDSFVFAITFWATGKIFASTISARIVAGAFNFLFGRRIVFRSSGQVREEALRYGGLVALLMLVSYASVTTLVDVAGMSVMPAKILSEAVLFLLSFSAQRVFVFHRSNSNEAPVKKTDWDAYYEKPAKPAQITRKITTNKLLRCLRMYKGNLRDAHILEWGGANSCFYRAIREEITPHRYLIADSNRTGLRKFKENWPESREVELRERDILRFEKEPAKAADICFSVGLIEHFHPEETARAIDAHFHSVKDGGLVTISFPTPTWLYRLTRWCAERLGVWAFHDERPLRMDEVLSEVRKHGVVLHTEINWPIFLTQGIVVAEARSAGESRLHASS